MKTKFNSKFLFIPLIIIPSILTTISCSSSNEEKYSILEDFINKKPKPIFQKELTEESISLDFFYKNQDQFFIDPSFYNNDQNMEIKILLEMPSLNSNDLKITILVQYQVGPDFPKKSYSLNLSDLELKNKNGNNIILLPWGDLNDWNESFNSLIDTNRGLIENYINTKLISRDEIQNTNGEIEILDSDHLNSSVFNGSQPKIYGRINDASQIQINQQEFSITFFIENVEFSSKPFNFNFLKGIS
ncbi:MAG: hypothetical protein ACRCRZ_00400 [Metamycoplasmataceae bacterium]